jgi:hypothetical protein
MVEMEPPPPEAENVTPLKVVDTNSPVGNNGSSKVIVPASMELALRMSADSILNI